MSIRINDLTVRFKNGVVAVNKASLEIPNGIYGLLGENGAGKDRKSTRLNSSHLARSRMPSSA